MDDKAPLMFGLQHDCYPPVSFLQCLNPTPQLLQWYNSKVWTWTWWAGNYLFVAGTENAFEPIVQPNQR